MIDGEMLNVEEFLSKDYFRLNQCFMQRRNPDVDPVALYGNRYVDSVITYHHLQFGKVVYVDACDCMYVKNVGSVTETLVLHSKDHVVIWCLGLYIPLLIPILSRYFFMGAEYQSIREVLKMAKAGYQVHPSNYRSLENLHAYIYDCFNREISIADKLRLWFTDVWMKLMKKTGMINSASIGALKCLLYN